MKSPGQNKRIPITGYGNIQVCGYDAIINHPLKYAAPRYLNGRIRLNFTPPTAKQTLIKHCQKLY